MAIFAKDFMARGGAPASGGGEPAAAWTRPSDWLAMPTVTTAEEKFVGLHAVWPTDGNFVAFTFAGAYTVDWGDGSAPENVASGTTAYHEYTYSGISSSTDSTRGYRQVIVTVTPQSGASLTSMNLFVKHNQSGLVSGYSTGWLDVAVRLPNLTSITIGSSSTTVRHNLLEQVKLLENGTVTNFSSLFHSLKALQSVQLDDTSGVTTMNDTFYGCGSLQSVPLFDTSSVTSMGSMFRECYALHTLPLFDTSSVTNMGSMFQNCSALQSVPLFDTSSVTAMGSMFTDCYSLHTVPLFDTSSVTNMGSMFWNCRRLESVPLFDTSLVTSMNRMFQSCFTISSIPALDASSATSSSSYSSMFTDCRSLASNGFTGHKFTFSVQNNKMSAAALDALYTNLGTVVGQTITVSGNYGTAGDDPTIATLKGWTVTG